MSSITAIVNELDEINQEIDNIKKRQKQLNERKIKLESEILKYLEEKEQPGLKYKNIAIVAEDKEKIKRKKRKEKLEDGINLLKDNGISNAENLLTKLLETMKGEKEEKKIIKFKKLK